MGATGARFKISCNGTRISRRRSEGGVGLSGIPDISRVPFQPTRLGSEGIQNCGVILSGMGVPAVFARGCWPRGCICCCSNYNFGIGFPPVKSMPGLGLCAALRHDSAPSAPVC